MGGSLIHQASDKLIDAQYDIAYISLSDFEMIRLEIEGKKKKGFRRELRFKATLPLRSRSERRWGRRGNI